jgi:hypothetical protein
MLGWKQAFKSSIVEDNSDDGNRDSLQNIDF